MSAQILRIAAALYAAAAVAFVVHFARPRHQRLARWGTLLLGVAFLVHAVAIGFGCREYRGTEFFSLRGGIFLLAWLLAGAYLLLQRFFHVPTVGAFVTPLILLGMLPLLFGVPGRSDVAPETVRNPSVTIHVISAILGVALFAMAAGVALMYLLQEREVKGKRFGALFSRLPPLEALDRLNQRLVRAGFLVFTVALIAGSLVAKGVWKSFWQWDPQQVISLLVWLLYGTMVQMRHTGWHGRRYALLTLVGFAVVIGSMVSLQMIPGLTAHTGSYQGPGVSP
jgi:HemX protein